MEKDSERDFFSDLPESIIETILKKLPIKDAVRTSIISTRWRYRWASMTHLVFDDRIGEDNADLLHFITKFLFLHDGPIHKFSISSAYMRVSPEIDQWLLFLSRKDVKELVIELAEEDWFTVPSCIFSFKNLNRLELYHCALDPPPKFKGFLWLKCLDLQQVSISRDDFECLIASCPLLESLTMSSFESLDITIRAPNLKYLIVEGEFIELCLSHTPLLVSASITMYMNDEMTEYFEQNSSCYLDKFLGGAPKLESLTGNLYFTKFLSVGIDNGRRLMTHHHLKFIELDEVSFEDVNEVLVMLQMIVNSPNLETLHVSVSTASRVLRDTDDLRFWDKKLFFDVFMLRELKTVKLKDVTGMAVEMGFMKFLLEHSPRLKEMTVRPSNYALEASMSILVELVSFQRASPQASIFFIQDQML